MICIVSSSHSSLSNKFVAVTGIALITTLRNFTDHRLYQSFLDGLLKIFFFLLSPSIPYSAAYKSFSKWTVHNKWLSLFLKQWEASHKSNWSPSVSSVLLSNSSLFNIAHFPFLTITLNSTPSTYNPLEKYILCELGQRHPVISYLLRIPVIYI